MRNFFGKRTAALILSLAMALALTLPVSAAEQKSVEVTTGVGLVINGLPATPTDAAGKAAEPLYYHLCPRPGAGRGFGPDCGVEFLRPLREYRHRGL